MTLFCRHCRNTWVGRKITAAGDAPQRRGETRRTVRRWTDRQKTDACPRPSSGRGVAASSKRYSGRLVWRIRSHASGNVPLAPPVHWRSQWQTTAGHWRSQWHTTVQGTGGASGTQLVRGPAKRDDVQSSAPVASSPYRCSLAWKVGRGSPRSRAAWVWFPLARCKASANSRRSTFSSTCSWARVPP
jgi:hypothetical protein